MICITNVPSLRKNNRGGYVGSSIASQDFYKSLLLENDLEIAILDDENVLKEISKELYSIGRFENVYLESIQRIKPFVEANSISAYHSFSMDVKSCIYARDTYSQKRVPVTGLIHGISQSNLLWERFALIWLSKFSECDSIICSSAVAKTAFDNIANCVREYLLELGCNNINPRIRTDIINLGVDIENFYPRNKNESRDLLSIPKEKIVILVFGRVSYEAKANLDPFFGVVKKLNEQNLDLVVVIAGAMNPNDERKLSMSINRYSLNNVLVFKNVTTDKIPYYYSSADIVVCLSDTLQESFGLTPLEAMACGIPVVVPDWSGYKETVQHGKVGFRIRTLWSDSMTEIEEMSPFRNWIEDHSMISNSVSFDIHQMYVTLLEMVKNEQLRRVLGSNALEHVVANYDIKYISRKYKDLVHDLNLIADRMNLSSISNYKANWFMKPKYFNCFKQYSTAHLGYDDLVKKSPFTLVNNINTSYVNDVEGVMVADLVILFRYIGIFGGDGVRVGYLCDIISDKYAMDKERTLYGLSVLIKFGFLVVCDND